MAKNTKLLNHILNYSNELAGINNHSISVNFFLLACINYVTGINQLVDISIDTESLKDETLRIKHMLYGHIRSLESFRTLLLNEINSDDYCNLQSEHDFVELKFSVKNDLYINFGTSIETKDYLEKIFENPSDFISELLDKSRKEYENNKDSFDENEYANYLDFLSDLVESEEDLHNNSNKSDDDLEDETLDDIEKIIDEILKDNDDSSDEPKENSDLIINSSNGPITFDEWFKNEFVEDEIKNEEEIDFDNLVNEEKNKSNKKPFDDEEFESFLKTFENLNTKNNKKNEENDESDLDSLYTEESNNLENLTENNFKNNKNQLSETINNTKRIRDSLLRKVFGQDYVIDELINGYFHAELKEQLNKDSNKPKAAFLFAGPPGVGKTYLASQFAEELNLPFGRFDMSEYCDKEASIEFIGSDNVYKDGKRGNFTSFLENNSKSVILFDEIEKAHITIIHLFLQILDAGRIRDNFTDSELSLSDCIIIMTTNAGKTLYESATPNTNLSLEPKKKILNSLSVDINPATHDPLFPSAILSRFSGGNVIMFNHLEPHNLLKIIDNELNKYADKFKEKMDYNIVFDFNIPSVILFSQGGKADARNVTGKTQTFFHTELFELFRLTDNDSNVFDTLEKINYNIKFDNNASINKLFSNDKPMEVLVYSEKEVEKTIETFNTDIKFHFADDLEKAKDILFNNDITIVLCDILYGAEDNVDVLNLEDVKSLGMEFMHLVLSKFDKPVYALLEDKSVLSNEEIISFSKLGAKGFIYLNDNNEFVNQISNLCINEFVKSNIIELAKTNKVLSYKSAQRISADGKVATIDLYDLSLIFAPDTGDSDNLLSDISRPNLKFSDVIGANDAKEELKYFTDYLLNPVKFMRKGVKAPKGILLYGPPGTGKTLLAKAMAGESKVTFISIEGNRFIKKHVGEGAEFVHKIFALARKYAPSIIFVDEIDVIAKDRIKNNDDKGDVLTAFLTEMDGFSNETPKPVFVLAATNYNVDPNDPKSLDGALLRRFDRKIYIDLPNKSERKQYLEMRASDHKLFDISNDEIENLAVRSTSMSLATLDLIFEFSKREAIRKNSLKVTDSILEFAFETFISGEIKHTDKDYLKRIAIHESGHALVSFLVGNKPSYLTIVSRGNYGGYLFDEISEDKQGYTKNELLNEIKICLAGRAAEIVYYGDEEGVSSGASSDLATSTNIAESIVCKYGMDKSFGLGIIYHLTDEIRYSKEVRSLVNNILSTELEKTIDLIKSNKDLCDKLINTLLEQNYLKANEIIDILTRK